MNWERAFLEATDIKESSKKQYVANMHRIIRLCGTGDVIKIMTNPVDVIAHFKKNLGKPSVKVFMSTINSLFKHVPDLAVRYASHREIWKQAIKELSDDLYERVASGKPSDKEIVSWIPWDRILAKEREMAKMCYASPDHMLLATYTLIEPMRGDFGDIRVTKTSDEKNAMDVLGENHVFLSSQSGGTTLTLYHYKTNTTYGSFVRTIPDELVRIWSTNLNESPRAFLFVDSHGLPYTRRAAFVKYVNKTLLQIFQKNITIRILRHSFISAIDFNNTPTSRLNEISKNMQHSIEQQMLYRRKVPEMQIRLENDEEPSPSPTPVSDASRPQEKKKKKKKRRGHFSHGRIISI